MLKLMCSLLLLIVLGVLLLQLDDELVPGAQALLDKVSVREGSDAYVYLLGMGAAPGEDPRAAGQAQLKAIRNWQRSYRNNRRQPGAGPILERTLPLPDGALFCNRREDGCITSLLKLESENATAQIHGLLSEHHLLMERYAEFMQLSDYSTQTISSLQEPIPEFSYLVKANRLMLLKALALSAEGQLKPALDLLSGHLVGLRIQLANQDNLIGMMVFIFQISDLLDIYYGLAAQDTSDADLRIDQLSKEEKAFEQRIAREFAMTADMVAGLDRNPDIWAVEGMSEGYAPGWSVRAVFKPNMSLNTIFPLYEQAIQYSLLSASEFAQKMEHKDVPEWLVSRFRNPLGSRLLTMSVPEFLSYVGVMFDLDVKITLLNVAVEARRNAVHSGQGLRDRLSQLPNPYYEGPHPPNWHAAGNRLCFEGPLPDTRSMRCLVVY